MERRPLTWPIAACPDSATVQLDELARDVQAKTGATNRRTVRHVNPLEAFEEPPAYDSTQYPPFDFCQSKLAYTSAPRACPGPSYTMGSTGSPVDDLLVQVSSSKAGTCDHYFPMSKNESLSTLFADLAGTISRGQLTH